MIRCLLEKVFWWHNFKIETEYVQYAQKQKQIFVTFVNTYVREYDIIILVKPPNTLYIVFAIPHSKNTFS